MPGIGIDGTSNEDGLERHFERLIKLKKRFSPKEAVEKYGGRFCEITELMFFSQLQPEWAGRYMAIA